MNIVDYSKTKTEMQPMYFTNIVPCKLQKSKYENVKQCIFLFNILQVQVVLEYMKHRHHKKIFKLNVIGHLSFIVK